jgi:hypothetical protein
MLIQRRSRYQGEVSDSDIPDEAISLMKRYFLTVDVIDTEEEVAERAYLPLFAEEHDRLLQTREFAVDSCP